MHKNYFQYFLFLTFIVLRVTGSLASDDENWSRNVRPKISTENRKNINCELLNAVFLTDDSKKLKEKVNSLLMQGANPHAWNDVGCGYEDCKYRTYA